MDLYQFLLLPRDIHPFDTKVIDAQYNGHGASLIAYHNPRHNEL